MIIDCEHPQLKLYEIPLSDGRPSYREVCIDCEKKMPWFVPMQSDKSMTISSYKHQGKTLGDIAIIDRDYLRWVVEESKASSRIKNAAARIYQGRPFTPKNPGDTYSYDERYII